MMKKEHTALILIDLQNDFCEGGSLAVPGADAIITIINKLQKYFDFIIATKDWHPKDHMSFASNHPGLRVGEVTRVNQIEQILWPDHCIQESKGSDFHPKLETSAIKKIFFKGVDKSVDSYSAFFDNAKLRSTGLADYLIEHGINKIYVAGLATDYCVLFSCLDAARLGFEVYLIKDACRGVELHPGDIANAIHEMEKAGVKIVTAEKELLS